MEWLEAIRRAIDYMEAHLNEPIGVQEVASLVNISPYLFGKGFSILTGCSVSEYIRNRRLYLAALALKNTDKTVLDTALEYGYDTLESFTKAFVRFHGNTPTAIKKGAGVKTFLPLRVQVTVQGGNEMNCKITKMFGMKFIGFQKVFSMDSAYVEIPKFWDEIMEKYAGNVYAGNPPKNAYEKAVQENGIGEFAICIDDLGNEQFRYLVAGRYSGGEVPVGMETYEFPAGEWAVFHCIGAIPTALQSLNTRIFREWLPGNAEYELCGNASIEWYDPTNGDTQDPNYHSAIWLPVKHK